MYYILIQSEVSVRLFNNCPLHASDRSTDFEINEYIRMDKKDNIHYGYEYQLGY
jgi:hypothetical protein